MYVICYIKKKNSKSGYTKHLGNHKNCPIQTTFCCKYQISWHSPIPVSAMGKYFLGDQSPGTWLIFLFIL